MKLLTFRVSCLPLILLTFHFSRAQVIPFEDKRWVIESQGKILEGYKGKNALYLQNGMAYLKEVQFLNGIIEFDIYLFQRTSFSGLVFRLVDPLNYEEIYFRSQQSGYPDAYQYTPVFFGNASWQLYHDQYDGVNDGFVSWKPRGKGMGYNAVIQYHFDRWVHVRLVVNGTRAEFYLDNELTPTGSIKELKRGERPGAIGVKSSVGATYFANFSFTPLASPELRNTEQINLTSPEGTVPNWQISSAFRESFLNNKISLDPGMINHLKWITQSTEREGFVNISRSTALTDSTNTVLARLKIQSESDQVKKLDIGYSDRVRVFFNGGLFYTGNANFRTRDFRYLGTIGYFEAIYLPLKKGENTLVVAVSETFGGWGLQSRFENLNGIRLIE